MGQTLPKTSKSDTSNTDNGANSGTEDLAALRAELADLKAGKASTDAELRQARGALRTAELSRMSADERAIVSDQEACDARLESMEGEATSIEDQIAQLADEPGHGKEIAVLTRKLSTLSANLVDENRRKAYLAGQREKVTNQNKQHREAAPADGERLLANGIVFSKLAAPTQAWLEKRPKAFTDARYAKLLVNTAQRAVDIEGLADNSPEFFRFIEDEMGEGAADTTTTDDIDEDEGEEIAADPTHESYTPERPQSRAAGPGAMSSAAPPTRQAPAGGSGGPRRAPTLSAEEREAALNIYSHLNISDADKIVKYATGKKYMKDRQNLHFGNN